MPRVNPHQPLVVSCELCQERLPTTRRNAWYDAIDHAIDEHRDQLIRTPSYARRFFRITDPIGRRARLATAR